MSDGKCIACGKVLTAEELHYYEIKCNACERAWNARVQAWRKGAHDPELDAAYSIIDILKGGGE